MSVHGFKIVPYDKPVRECQGLEFPGKPCKCEALYMLDALDPEQTHPIYACRCCVPVLVKLLTMLDRS